MKTKIKQICVLTLLLIVLTVFSYVFINKSGLKQLQNKIENSF